MSSPRNILFITADQWRGECLGTLGHKVVKTPSLDAFAKESVLFARHFANTAPCAPSRASLYTGLYLHNHRVAMNGTPLDRRHTNWALELRKAGYDPALIGYTDQTIDPRDAEPNDPRLREWEGLLPGITPIAQTGTDPGPWGEYCRAKGYAVPDDMRLLYFMREPGPDYEDGAPHPKALAIKTEDDDTTWHINTAIDYINQRRKDSWALHLSLLRPHPPWIASDPWNKLYDPQSVPGFVRRENPPSEGEQHPWLSYQLSRRIFKAPSDDRKMRRMKAVYYGLMSEVDHHLGRLFDHLKSEGLWDSTLIVFTSDHGEEMGDHWLLGKSGYFDQSYAIPCLIHDPRCEADSARGKVVTAFTENVDLLPTMLEWAGLNLPPLDGHSLSLFLERGIAPRGWRQAAHWEYDFRDVSNASAEEALGLTLDTCNLAVLRDENFKYVHFASLPPLLFDLKNDPNEFTNLASNPAYFPRVLEYAQKMLSWRMRHDDQTLTHMMATVNGLKQR
jgi:arylsulfatase A-like enzyme